MANCILLQLPFSYHTSMAYLNDLLLISFLSWRDSWLTFGIASFSTTFFFLIQSFNFGKFQAQLEVIFAEFFFPFNAGRKQSTLMLSTATVFCWNEDRCNYTRCSSICHHMGTLIIVLTSEEWPWAHIWTLTSYQALWMLNTFSLAQGEASKNTTHSNIFTASIISLSLMRTVCSLLAKHTERGMPWHLDNDNNKNKSEFDQSTQKQIA